MSPPRKAGLPIHGSPQCIFQKLNELVDMGFRPVLNQGNQFSVNGQEYLGKTIDACSVDGEGSQVSLTGTTLNPAITNESS